MKRFTNTKIINSNDIIGEQLTAARLNLKISLEEASKKTGINKKYLEALENGHVELLPKGVYRKNFLREYSSFLNLDAKEIIKEYEGENEISVNRSQKNLFSPNASKKINFVSAPKIVKNLIIVLAIGLCLIYFIYNLNNLFSPPFLTINYPPDNFITSDSSLAIAGKTEQNTEVFVNNNSVLLDSGGGFNKTINLKKGLNLITITSQKKYSKKNTVTLTVELN